MPAITQASHKAAPIAARGWRSNALGNDVHGSDDDDDGGGDGGDDGAATTSIAHGATEAKRAVVMRTDFLSTVFARLSWSSRSSSAARST